MHALNAIANTPRGLRPAPRSWGPPPIAHTLPPPPVASIWLAAIAVALHLTLSTNLMFHFGIDYAAPGGNPIVKFHAGTYCVLLALLVRMSGDGRPLQRLGLMLRQSPHVALFEAAALICVFYTLAMVGTSGVAAYVESYVSPGALLLVIADASARQKRVLGWTLLTFLTFNVVLSAIETSLHWHMVPFYLGGKKLVENAEDFRGLALYNDPLQGAVMSEIGLLLVLAMRLPPVSTALLTLTMVLGLVSFGGRTALVVTLGSLATLGGINLVQQVVRRTLRPGMIVATLIGLVAVSALVWILLSETSIGVRLGNKLFTYDESADIRSLQWHILGMLSIPQMLFGVNQDTLLEMMFQLGLHAPANDIENFWLLTFLNLGGIVFATYVVGIAAFFVHLWRMAPFFARVMLVLTIVIASGNNSLARKSDLLVILVAAITAAVGFAARTKPVAAVEPTSLVRRIPLRSSPLPSRETALARQPALSDRRALRPSKLRIG